LETIRKNWLVNLSLVNIPQDIQCLLQLEENFSLPPLNKEKITIELIKSVECISQKFDIDTQLNLRNKAITIINNLPSMSPINNSTNQRLTELMKSCKSFIYNNPNIIITRADKGNTTVVLNHFEYINRIIIMLQDTNILLHNRNWGKKLNFLDVTIINNNNFIEFNWYHKPTFSGRYLNFLSQHPLSQKRGTVMGTVDRSFFLSHPRFHRESLKYIITLLLENDYPLKFIFNTINTRLKYLISHHKQQRIGKNPNENN